MLLSLSPCCLEICRETKEEYSKDDAATLLSFLFAIYRGGGVNGSGGGGNHKSSQHNQQSTGGRAEHRSGLGDQPGQYATLSKQCKTLESSDFY